MFKQFLLAAALVAAPVGAFTAYEMLMKPPAPVAAAVSAPSLGDLAPMRAIAADVQGIVAKGDLAAAKTRIKDLETAWDDAQPTMQAAAPEAWGTVDGAIDTALKSLRADSPTQDAATAALTALLAVMDNPAPAAGGTVAYVKDIAVTDANGHPLPCEQLLRQVDTAIKATPGNTAAIDLQTKALERCNADDDRNANQFSAEALALLKV